MPTTEMIVSIAVVAALALAFIHVLRLIGVAMLHRTVRRAFVGRVTAFVRVEERLRARRAAALRRLAAELVALGAVAGGVLWLARSPEIAGFIAESQTVAVAGLLSGFALLVVLLSTTPATRSFG